MSALQYHKCKQVSISLCSIYFSIYANQPQYPKKLQNGKVGGFVILYVPAYISGLHLPLTLYLLYIVVAFFMTMEKAECSVCSIDI